MRHLLALLGRLRRDSPPPPAPIDHEQLREEMTQTDPDFAHVREVHHDALNVLASEHATQQMVDRAVQDGRSLRAEREFWDRYGGQARQ